MTTFAGKLTFRTLKAKFLISSWKRTFRLVRNPDGEYCWRIFFSIFFLRTTQASASLENGSCIVFYGDSITESGFYTRIIETFITLQYPTRDFTFFNSGSAGDKITGGGLGPIDERINRDIVSLHPNRVTVMLGMNDAGYQPLDSAKLRKFSHDYKYFLRKIRALLPHADIWLLQSTPFDDITRPLLFPGGYNSVLRKYGSSVGVIAKKYKVNTIDLNTPVTQVLNCAAKRDPEAAMDIIVDRFHPGNGGHWIVAAKILRAWKFQPIILETRLNWKLKSVSGRNSLVTDWVGNRFKIKEKTLPSPVPDREAGTQLALSCSPDIKWLSKELLKIEQLPLGSYRLDLDGQNIGKFSAQQFSKGIELHRLDTPMMAQARKVLELTERIAAHYGIRKLVIGPNDLPIDQLKSQRRLLAQTQWHSFELIYTGP